MQATDTKKGRTFTIPFIAYSEYRGMPYVARSKMAIEAEDLDGALSFAYKEGLSTLYYKAWSPRWEVDEATAHEKGITQTKIEKAKLKGLSSDDDYGAWFPRWQVDEDRLEELRNNGGLGIQPGRSFRTNPARRRDYMRNYRGYQKGDRSKMFALEFPEWEEIKYQLPDPEWRLIVEQYYCHIKSDAQIGEFLGGVTRQAIQKRRNKAMSALRKIRGKCSNDSNLESIKDSKDS